MTIWVEKPHETEPVIHQQRHRVGVVCEVAWMSRWEHVWAPNGRGFGNVVDADASRNAVVLFHIVAVGPRGGRRVVKGVENGASRADEGRFSVRSSERGEIVVVVREWRLERVKGSDFLIVGRVESREIVHKRVDDLLFRRGIRDESSTLWRLDGQGCFNLPEILR